MYKIYMTNYSPLLLIDFDGIIIKHEGNMFKQLGKRSRADDEGLSDELKNFFEEAYKLDAKIVFCTGRKESERKIVQDLLRTLHIQYDDLIMGCPRGARVIINDRKTNGFPTAAALLSQRNSFDWATINPGEIIMETPYGWRQLLDKDGDGLLYKINIKPGETMFCDDWQEADITGMLLSGNARTNFGIDRDRTGRTNLSEVKFMSFNGTSDVLAITNAGEDDVIIIARCV
jgi:hypothetical protein